MNTMTSPSAIITAHLLASGTPDAVLPPTTLYNEGWMLRLVLDWFARHREVEHPLSPRTDARWGSELLLRSRFLARSGFGRRDPLAEGWTHADGVVGHLLPRDRRGDARLAPGATQFVVVEAKMYSGLSAGTTRASTYGQAPRNVACMAETIRAAQRQPTDLEALHFVVLAPASQIDAGVFESQVPAQGSARWPAIDAAVRSRVEAYGDEHRAWYEQAFRPLASRLQVHLLSWESVLAVIVDRDRAAGRELRSFYDACRHWNRPATPDVAAWRGAAAEPAVAP